MPAMRVQSLPVKIKALVHHGMADLAGHVSEKILRTTLAGALRRAGLEVQEEVTIPVFARDRIVGHNRIDLLVHDGGAQCIIELKRLRTSLIKSPARVRAETQVFFA